MADRKLVARLYDNPHFEKYAKKAGVGPAVKLFAPVESYGKIDCTTCGADKYPRPETQSWACVHCGETQGFKGAFAPGDMRQVYQKREDSRISEIRSRNDQKLTKSQMGDTAPLDPMEYNGTLTPGHY